MQKYGVIFSIITFLLCVQCRDSEQSKHVAVLYQIDAPEIAAGFLSSVSLAADSLGIHVAKIDAEQAGAAAHLDTLVSHLDAIAAPAVISNPGLAEIIKKKCKRLPLLRFDTDAKASDDYYLTGHKAGRYITNEFGTAGRFGILTPSLDDANANESIRGFREELLTIKKRWRQVNIITYEENPAGALAQFKNMNRFGARTIWFLTDGNCNIMPTLKNYKKNCYFIAADLRANKNSIKLLREGVIDAMATTDFKNLGEGLVYALSGILQEKGSARVLPFKSTILTSKDAAVQFEQDIQANAKGDSEHHENLE